MFRLNMLRCKILCELKKLKLETITLLNEAFQNETLHDLTIHKWHRTFTDSREFAGIEHVSGRLWTVMADVNVNSVSGDWKIPPFIYSKVGRWPAHSENVNSAHFNKGTGNEACLFSEGSSFHLGWRSGASSFCVFGKSGMNIPRSRLYLSCHHCWQILLSSLWS